jgi:hypothetical protein
VAALEPEVAVLETEVAVLEPEVAFLGDVKKRKFAFRVDLAEFPKWRVLYDFWLASQEINKTCVLKIRDMILVMKKNCNMIRPFGNKCRANGNGTKLGEQKGSVNF